MTESEAARCVDLLRELWPSKFHWTPGTTGLWTERLARHEFDARQVEAVIRQARTEDDGHKPSMKRILARCWDVHKARSRVPNASEHQELTPAKWAEIFRDREAAAAWWHENRADAAEIVGHACRAFPLYADKFRRFLDAKFTPSPVQCVRLRAAWNEWHERGATA